VSGRDSRWEKSAGASSVPRITATALRHDRGTTEFQKMEKSDAPQEVWSTGDPPE
jgi:hypothetical protein